MREVGSFEAKTHLSALLELVELGEHITITRRGKPVAQLVPLNKDSTGNRSELILRIEKLRTRILSKKGVFSKCNILSARDEGRR